MFLSTFIFLVATTTILAHPHIKTSAPTNIPQPCEIVQSYNYPCEIHYVRTEDNYILQMHRIPHGLKSNSTQATPLLLVHGLQSSSADWIIYSPEHSLGYILADAGFDVWITNARGNSYSRNHTTLDPENELDQAQFFNFSWHEIGYYDHPAEIDYVLNLTGARQIHYAGHSQGGTTFLVMATTRPEYNEKIKLASLMAPASIMAHQDHLYPLCLFIDELYWISQEVHLYEVPFLDLAHYGLSELCPQEEYHEICLIIYTALAGGEDLDQIDWDIVKTLGTSFPASAAIKQFIHYGQEIKSKGFNLFDYGTDRNLELYGQSRPPPYDLSKISAPVAVYYGLNDRVAHFEDAKTLITLLPNAVLDYPVPYEKFNHLDFVIAKDAATLLYNDLVKNIKEYK